MKRCPRCYETYDESEKFCELDGQPLLAEPTLSVPAAATSSVLASPSANAEVSRSPQQKEVWFVGTAGVVLGIVVCVGGYLAYGLWNEDPGFKDPSAPASSFAAQSRDPFRLLGPKLHEQSQPWRPRRLKHLNQKRPRAGTRHNRRKQHRYGAAESRTSLHGPT